MPDLVNVNRIHPSKSRKMSITSNGCCADDEGPTEGLMLGRLQCWELPCSWLWSYDHPFQGYNCSSLVSSFTSILILLCLVSHFSLFLESSRITFSQIKILGQYIIELLKNYKTFRFLYQINMNNFWENRGKFELLHSR